MAYAFCTPTPIMGNPGTMVEGATAGVDWQWNASFAGVDVENSPNVGHNIFINVLATDTGAQIKSKIVAAASAYTTSLWATTVSAANCLTVDIVWAA